MEKYIIPKIFIQSPCEVDDLLNRTVNGKRKRPCDQETNELLKDKLRRRMRNNCAIKKSEQKLKDGVDDIRYKVKGITEDTCISEYKTKEVTFKKQRTQTLRTTPKDESRTISNTTQFKNTTQLSNTTQLNNTTHSSNTTQLSNTTQPSRTTRSSECKNIQYTSENKNTKSAAKRKQNVTAGIKFVKHMTIVDDNLVALKKMKL